MSQTSTKEHSVYTKSNKTDWVAATLRCMNSVEYLIGELGKLCFTAVAVLVAGVIPLGVVSIMIASVMTKNSYDANLMRDAFQIFLRIAGLVTSVVIWLWIKDKLEARVRQ